MCEFAMPGPWPNRDGRTAVVLGEHGVSIARLHGERAMLDRETVAEARRMYLEDYGQPGPPPVDREGRRPLDLRTLTTAANGTAFGVGFRHTPHRGSTSDVLAPIGVGGESVVAAVEGKVGETFGNTIDQWFANPSGGKKN